MPRPTALVSSQLPKHSDGSPDPEICNTFLFVPSQWQWRHRVHKAHIETVSVQDHSNGSRLASNSFCERLCSTQVADLSDCWKYNASPSGKVARSSRQVARGSGFLGLSTIGGVLSMPRNTLQRTARGVLLCESGMQCSLEKDPQHHEYHCHHHHDCHRQPHAHRDTDQQQHMSSLTMAAAWLFSCSVCLWNLSL